LIRVCPSGVFVPAGPLGDTQVVIAPIACGIFGTDLHEYIAGPIVTPKVANVLTGATLPQILGHEFSARVLDVGRLVRSRATGYRSSR
jgi:(R,R)-butanediol dehydrogenase/meso-butanediol dehydrogenase/diacetyl reductase